MTDSVGVKCASRQGAILRLSKSQLFSISKPDSFGVMSANVNKTKVFFIVTEIPSTIIGRKNVSKT